MYNCRLCNSDKLYPFLDLGFTPPADQFKRLEQLKEPEVHYPLVTCMCENCGFMQLNHVVSPEILYRNDYPYESSVTQTGKKHWKQFAQSVTEKIGLGKDDLVVDIGSNVGVLLSEFEHCGVDILGVDPAANIARIAEQNGIETICDFFSSSTVNKIIQQKSKASVITGTNVFAHIDNLKLFMTNVVSLLRDDGTLVIEAPYFLNLLKHLEYDTIYHEHLSYISIKPLVPFLAKYQMEISDIIESDIHGGSIRIFINKIGQRKLTERVFKHLDQEEKYQIYGKETLDLFAQNVKDNRDELLKLLCQLKSEGKSIVGISAPAKGMTLLNYCKIGNHVLDVVTEKSQLKIGRYTPGSHIPVVPDSYLVENKPDYALLLAWNFSEEIIANNISFKEGGGKFIIPIPKPHII